MNCKFYDSIASLPIAPHLEEICDKLKSSPSRFLILTAQTGAGKSTAVPLALLENFPKKIFMLEPRRLAAIAIANRTAELLGQNVGETCGYTVYLESKTSKATRLEIMTEAILTRRLQSDPSLQDASVVVLDEFHERSINADIALAFLKEAMSLRDDLFVIIMSATIDAKKLSEFCGTKIAVAPIMQIDGRTFPVEMVYEPNLTVARATMLELSQIEGGAILVFLPGIYEIKKVQSELKELFDIGIGENGGVQKPQGVQGAAVEILILHSSINFDEQKKILSPAPPKTKRVILSSAIAETSLTVPDVVCVIDSGLCRFNQMNIANGLSQLVTVPESEFSAAQRAGRAGRTQAGKCVRLWSKNEPRQKNSVPEILRADLAELVLECAEWGCHNVAALEWLDEPQESAWQAAQELLRLLNCIDENNSIMPLGKACLKLGLGPRLGLIAIFDGAEFAMNYSQYKDASPHLQKKFIQNVKTRLASLPPLQELCDEKLLPQFLQEPLLAGFPDRIAILTNDAAAYQFPSGRVAKLKNYAGGVLPKYIVATEVDAGQTQGTIFSYKPLDQKFAEEWLFARAETKTVCELDFSQSGAQLQKVKKSQITHYGKIILSQKNLVPNDEDFKKAVCDSVEKKGFDILPLDEKTQLFLRKVKFYKQQESHTEKPLPSTNPSAASTSFGEENLAASMRFCETEPFGSGTPATVPFGELPPAEQWLLPFLTENKITAKNVYDALYYFFDGANIEQKVPSRITLENGKSVKVNYEDGAQIQPTIEIIIQQIFGCFTTPKILGKPVLLKLLSPARRPLQITSDLENFWQNTWQEICKEMHGRYPKHNWDYRVQED